LALWAYVVVIGSGLANAWIRLSTLSDIWTTGYGRLLLIKTGCAIALGWLGWYHRKRTIRSSVLHGQTAGFIRFATIEVVIMVATIGVGVGLSQTAPPVNDAIDLTKASAARLVLGFELPPPPTAFSVLVQQVRPDALWIFVALLLGALYALGIRKLAAQGDKWPMGRTISWVGGWLIILWSTSGGIATYSHVLFSAHMVQHMLLSTVAPIFLVLGAPASLALRALPTGSNGAGVRELLVSVLNSRFIHFVSNPIVAAIVFVSGFFGLYFTALFPALMGSHWGHTIMQVHFLLAGYLFFWTLIGIDPGPKRAPYPIRILVLLASMSIHAFFNIAILQSNEILAQSYFASIERPYLTDLLADQRVGADIGWALGELPLLIVMITLTVQWSRTDARDAKRSDRQADRAARGDGGPDKLGDYNAYLAKLADRDAKN
jgi:putative copper resistance protein D